MAYAPREAINMDLVVFHVNRAGYDAYVEQTGGGVATIYAGTPIKVDVYNDGQEYNVYPILAGPGSFGWGQEPSIGSIFDFHIGPDTEDPWAVDPGSGIQWHGAANDEEIAEYIVALLKMRGFAPRKEEH